MAASRTKLLSLAALTLGTQVLSLLAACRHDAPQRADKDVATAQASAKTDKPEPAAGQVAGSQPATPTQGEPSPAAPADAWARFFDSGLAYCDAAVLAQHWGGTPDDAKTKVGTLLAAGETQALDQALAAARSAVKDPALLCPFHESDYSIAEAEALAALWGVGLADAKARIERKLVWGHHHLIKEYLAEARDPAERAEGQGEAAGDDAAFRDIFWDSTYTACDAEVMARHWEMDIMDAKAFAGRKIDAGNRSVVEDRLRAARTALESSSQELCPFHYSGYSYADAEVLAAVWEMDVEEAKANVSDKLFWGGGENIDAALASGRARPRRGRGAPQ